MKSNDADREVVKFSDGLLVGQLDMDALDAFNRCIEDGFAVRSYEGICGEIGLPTVRLGGGNSNKTS